MAPGRPAARGESLGRSPAPRELPSRSPATRVRRVSGSSPAAALREDERSTASASAAFCVQRLGGGEPVAIAIASRAMLACVRSHCDPRRVNAPNGPARRAKAIRSLELKHEIEDLIAAGQYELAIILTQTL